MKELKERLSWIFRRIPMHCSALLHQSAGQNYPQNMLASQYPGWIVRGDVAVPRSSPEEVDDDKTANSQEVLQQRERS